MTDRAELQRRNAEAARLSLKVLDLKRQQVKLNTVPDTGRRVLCCPHALHLGSCMRCRHVHMHGRSAFVRKWHLAYVCQGCMLISGRPGLLDDPMVPQVAAAVRIGLYADTSVLP